MNFHFTNKVWFFISYLRQYHHRHSSSSSSSLVWFFIIIAGSSSSSSLVHLHRCSYASSTARPELLHHLRLLTTQIRPSTAHCRHESQPLEPLNRWPPTAAALSRSDLVCRRCLPPFPILSIEGFKNYGIRNTESLAELFVSFLTKLASVANIWRKGLCASLYHGKWISKTWATGIANMSVEDFMNQQQNFARCVVFIYKLYGC